MKTPQSRDVQIDLGFPLEGVDSTRSFTRQRQGTSARALNVRAFDPKTDRARGAMRPGLSKYFDGKAVGDYPIQDIAHLVTNDVVRANTAALGQWVYAEASGSGYSIAGSDGVDIAAYNATASFEFICSCWDDAGNAYVAQRNQTTGATKIHKMTPNAAGTAYTTAWTITSITIPTGANRGITGMVVSGIHLYVSVLHTVAPVARIYKFQISSGASGVTADPNGLWISNANAAITGLRFSPASVNNMARGGNFIAVDSVGTGTGQGLYIFSITTGALAKYVGYGGTANLTSPSKVCSDGLAYFYVIAAVTTSQVKKIGWGGTVDWSLTLAATSLAYDFNNAMLVAATGVTPSIKSLSLTTGATLDSGDPGSITSWTHLDSDNNGVFTLFRTNATNNIMTVNTTLDQAIAPASYANSNQYGASVNKGKEVQSSQTGNRQVRGLLVSNGEIRRFDEDGATAITGGDALQATTPSIYSAQNNLNLYYVDGSRYCYYDSVTNAILAWTASAGTMPVDSHTARARLICTWRARTVLAGLPRDPSAIFMSAQYLPRNWDYFPSTQSSAQAVAIVSPDFVNCIVPYSDDTMIIGGDHTIYQLTGDPMDGGQMDRVSGLLGMAWGRSWCQDPSGQLFFFGTDCEVYRMSPGAIPIQMSQQIRRRLQSVNLSTHVIQMAWDMVNHGLGMWVTPLDADTETENFFWEERTNSWWPDQYGLPSMNPLCVHEFDGDSPNDRVIMIGSQNGYVRVLDNNADNDDGVPIDWEVVIGPINTRMQDDCLLKMIQATLGEDSGDVTYSIYVGDSAEEALVSEAVHTGVFRAGRNRSEYLRRSGYAVYVGLSGTAPASFEKIWGVYAPQGMVRRRR